MTALYSIVRLIGVTGCTVLALLAYYEGIPGIRDIPGTAHIPIVREFIAGRVEKVAAERVAAATAGLVARSELIAARSRAAELERQIDINKKLAESASRQAQAARIDADRAREDLERKIANDRDPDISRWRQRDLDRLRE